MGFWGFLYERRALSGKNKFIRIWEAYYGLSKCTGSLQTQCTFSEQGDLNTFHVTYHYGGAVGTRTCNPFSAHNVIERDISVPFLTHWEDPTLSSVPLSHPDDGVPWVPVFRNPCGRLFFWSTNVCPSWGGWEGAYHKATSMRPKNSPQRCPCPQSCNLWIFYFTW